MTDLSAKYWIIDILNSLQTVRGNFVWLSSSWFSLRCLIASAVVCLSLLRIHYFLSAMLFSTQAQILLGGIQIYQKLAKHYLTKRRLNAIYKECNHLAWSLVLNIFRDFCFKISHFQTSVVYKIVAYKKACITVCTIGYLDLLCSGNI